MPAPISAGPPLSLPACHTMPLRRPQMGRVDRSTIARSRARARPPEWESARSSDARTATYGCDKANVSSLRADQSTRKLGHAKFRKLFAFAPLECLCVRVHFFVRSARVAEEINICGNRRGRNLQRFESKQTPSGDVNIS